jgi:predicted alpha/beta-fold hydrolase
MPLLSSGFKPRPFLGNPHLQTVVPLALHRRIPFSRRQKLELADGDFLNLDWVEGGHSRLAVLSHGLEGSSRAHYFRPLIPQLLAGGWDVLAWNYRGCGGEPNRLFEDYHSGKSGDLRQVLASVPAGYKNIDLIGFSIGGNLTLKYLGEMPPDPRTGCAVAVSVPCDLAGCARHLARPGCRLYMENFLISLRRKIRDKDRRFPGRLDLRGLDRIGTFLEFDERYTATINGFRDAEHYWDESSSGRYLEAIRTPSLLLNALDDPFLSPGCHPRELAAAHEFLHLELAENGGHVGFVSAEESGWLAGRIVDFLENQRSP